MLKVQENVTTLPTSMKHDKDEIIKNQQLLEINDLEHITLLANFYVPMFLLIWLCDEISDSYDYQSEKESQDKWDTCKKWPTHRGDTHKTTDHDPRPHHPPSKATCEDSTCHARPSRYCDFVGLSSSG